MDIQIKTFQNKKQELTEGVFIGSKLIYSLSGFAQVRRGIIRHSRELGDRLGWLYIVLILLARPIGKDKGTLEISLKVLAQIMGKSLSQITRDLKDLARHQNKYILYEKAKGRYSRLAKIIIPKYPVDKSVDVSVDFCINDGVACIDAKVEDDTAVKNGDVTCIHAEVEVNNPTRIKEIKPLNNILITEKDKSLITEDDNLCGKILFIICLRALKDFNLTIESEELRTIVNKHCNCREIRGWCYDPETCYLQVYSVIEKMGRYEVSDHSRYFKTSLDNFLNENAQELSQKAKASNYAQKEKENF
jgi:hypothetical protein